MPQQFIVIIFAAAALLVIGGVSFLSSQTSLNNIKAKPAGDGQHGTARWATPKEIGKTYHHVPFHPAEWRKGSNLPKIQGLVMGSLGKKGKVTALVDSDDIHCLMIGAAGVGKTAFFLYPNLEYACACGMSFLALDTKGDLARNYGAIAHDCYGYQVSVIDLRNDGFLPMAGNESVTLFGRDSVDFMYGGGSGGLSSKVVRATMKEALETDGFTVNPTMWDFLDGLKDKYSRGASGVGQLLSVGEIPLSEYTSAVRSSYSQYGDAAIVVIGRSGSEGTDLDPGSNGSAHALELGKPDFVWRYRSIMEAAVNETSVLWQRFLKLADLFPRFRRPYLERELAEAETQINWQKKRTERIRQRYDVLDRQCAAMTNEVDGLRSRLHAAEQQAEAFKEVAKTYCAAVDTAEDLKRLYQAAAPYLDSGGFNLFDAAQEITGFSLSEEFPYEDACGCFEFLDGFELLRYVIASEFGVVTWEIVPGTECKKAVLGEVDESTPAYREFERQLYKRALERLGLRASVPPAPTRQD